MCTHTHTHKSDQPSLDLTTNPQEIQGAEEHAISKIQNINTGMSQDKQFIFFNKTNHKREENTWKMN